MRLRCPFLIGRDRELEQLGSALADVVGGQGRGLLIAGEAGGGKSALVREFAERARRASTRVFVGECAEAEARRPLGPFIDLLRSAVAGRDAASVRSTLESETPELARFLSDPRTLVPQPETHHRAGSAFASLFVALARSTPLVIVVEDIHWGDEVTWEVLPVLAQRCAKARVLLIATYRSDELHRRHPLRGVLGNLARLRVDTMALGPLSDNDSAAMVRATLGLSAPVPARLRNPLIERCEGNPFFIEEVLKALAERGDLKWEHGKWILPDAIGGVVSPPSVRDAVLERLAQLPPDARRVLQIAAVVGQRFEFALVRELADLEESGVIDALRAAIDAQLVEEDAADEFRFRHSLTRESILSDLLQRERGVLHLRVAEAIERRSGSNATVAGRLAYHFDEARDDARARRYHALAAKAAGRQMASVEAVRHVERAIALSSPDDPELLELYGLLTEYSNRTFNWRGTLRAAEAAAAIAAARGADIVRGTMFAHQASAHRALGEAERANEAFEQALRILEPLGDTSPLAMTYIQAAWRKWYGDGDAEAAYRWALRGHDVASRCGATVHRVLALQAMGLSKVAMGDQSGDDDLRQALHLATEYGTAPDVHRAYNALITSARLRGDRVATDELRGEEAAHCRLYGYRSLDYVQRESAIAVRQGRWDSAIALAEEFAGTGSQHEAITRLKIALIHVARDGPTHLAELDTTIAALRRSPLGRTTAAFGALVISLAGDHAAALEHVKRLLGPRGNDPWHHDEPVICALFDAIDIGADLRPWIELGLRDDVPRETPVLRARRLVAAAVRDGIAGDTDSELHGLEEAIDQLEVDPSPYLATRARCRRAVILAARQDHITAGRELAAGIAFWRGAGATWFTGELQRWAADHGIVLPSLPHDTSKMRTLTAREEQIATLVARGLTNKEIADTLVISERTAESHLERIRRKLGVRNRAQIAVWATESRQA